MIPAKLTGLCNGAEEGFPIIPTAIFYENADMAWVGDDPIGSHFARNFKKWSTTAHIVFGESMIGTDGEELMERFRVWELERLAELKEEFGDRSY